MSTSNGVLIPPLPQNGTTSTSPAKRKWTDDGVDDRVVEIENMSRKDIEQSHGDGKQIRPFLLDVLEVLRRRDTTPSILHMPLEPRNGTLVEPATKRQKTDDSEKSEKSVTIASKISSGAYKTLGSLAVDVDKAASNVLELLAQYALRTDQSGSHSQLSSSVTYRQAAVANVLAFKKSFASVILREKVQNGTLSAVEQQEVAGSNMHEEATESSVEERQRSLFSQQHAANANAHRSVLTLYGSAPQPKQLFSSLQKPIRITPKPSMPSRLALDISRENRASGATLLSSVEVLTPIRESSLPNGFSTTMIIPTHFPELKEEFKNSAPTLGEVFSPPATLPQLQPPKPSKYTTTRGNVVSLYNPAMDSRSSHRGSWTTQPLSTGEWLSYGGVPSIQQPSSPEAKRRKRERALSSGEQEAEIPVTPEWIARQNQARDEARAEAAFRRTYSSFAPTRDDTGAVVPAETRARLWWHRVGQDRYEQLINLDEPADQITGDQRPEAEVSTTTTQAEDDEEAFFKEAVENWQPEPPPAWFTANKAEDEAKSAENKSLEEILEETSQLIETLNSYQQVRNLSLTSGTSHSTIPQDPSICKVIGTPSSPSAAERELSDQIRTRLAAQIDQLPPYEVARMNGDQCAELNVSTRMVVPGKSYKGVMEEETIPKSISGVVGAGVGSGSSVRGGTTGVQYGAAQPGTYPSRPMYGTQATGSPRPMAQIRGQGSGQYYPQQTSPGRGSTLNTPRSTSANTGPPQGGAPPQNTPRGPYGGQTNPQQYFQNQSSVGYSQQYPPPTTTPYQRPSQPQYQQHAQQRQQNQIVYGGGSAARNASSAYAARMAAGKSTQQAPASYSSSTLATPTPSQNHPYASAASTPVSRAYLQGLNPSLEAATTQQPSSSLGASGFHTYLTPAEQASMMERQRAQLAAQQQQLQIHNTAAVANQRAVQSNLMTSVSAPSTVPAPGRAGAAGNTQVQNGPSGVAAAAQMIAQPVQSQTHQNQDQSIAQQDNDTIIVGGEAGSLSGGNTTTTEQINEQPTTGQVQGSGGQGQGQGLNEPVPVAMATGTTTSETATGMGGNNPITSKPAPATAVGGGNGGN